MESRFITQVVEAVLGDGVRKATKFISEKETVKATRRLFSSKVNKRSRITEIILTIGGPNYAERKFIKDAKKAGEPFPIKRVLIKRLKVA